MLDLKSKEEILKITLFCIFQVFAFIINLFNFSNFSPVYIANVSVKKTVNEIECDILTYVCYS